MAEITTQMIVKLTDKNKNISDLDFVASLNAILFR